MHRDPLPRRRTRRGLQNVAPSSSVLVASGAITDNVFCPVSKRRQLSRIDSTFHKSADIWYRNRYKL